MRLTDVDRGSLSLFNQIKHLIKILQTLLGVFFKIKLIGLVIKLADFIKIMIN